MYFRLVHQAEDIEVLVPLEDASLSENIGKIRVATVPSMRVFFDGSESRSYARSLLLNYSGVSGEIGQICVELDGDLYACREWRHGKWHTFD